MPAHHVGFALQPVGFFDRNPALDVPPPIHANGHGEHCQDHEPASSGHTDGEA